MKCLLALLLLGLVGFSWAFPLHASCTVNWSFGISCSDVQSKIVGQITAWNGPTGCTSGGEKCLYRLISSSPTQIKSTHETPKHHYIDDQTFTLTAGANTCQVKGHSTSELWYAILDHSTNYCNMRNLITGSGLDKVAGFSESTSDSHCTQYSSANCDKY